MSSFKIENYTIGSEHTFIIAEIGQNHQGDLNIAKKMISAAKHSGANCVKFQKSCLSEKFTADALKRTYDGINSWGKTYGEHKEHLEFSLDQYKELQSYAKDSNIIFTASAMDSQSLQDLYDLNVPVIKIGSGDTNNMQLLKQAAQNPTPLIISTGMQYQSTIEKIVQLMQYYKKTNYCLLHCVSSYPTAPQHANLRMLDLYRNLFPNICLGYSGHEQGIAISAAAVVLGARVVERHFTLDKTQKGTDHPLSLEPRELRELSTLIRNVEKRLQTKLQDDQSVLNILRDHVTEEELNDVILALSSVQEKTILHCELPCRLKLGKSLVYRKCIKSGSVLTDEAICAKVSEPFGISTEQIDAYIGRKLCKDVSPDQNLCEAHFC